MTPRAFLILLAWTAVAGIQTPAVAAQAARPPWAGPGERLVYRLLWASTLPLGEAVLQASSSGTELRFAATVEAELPQYNIRYSFSSTATEEGLCSLQFHQKISEGGRNWEESIEFDQRNRQAKRTRGGQTTTVSVPECARDPLTFLYYYRNQLALGKPLDSGTVHLGKDLDIRFEPAGQGFESVGRRKFSVDRFRVTYAGNNRGRTFELWLTADATRRPAFVRAPLSLAVFLAELQ